MDGRRERQPPDRHGLNKLPPETGELLLSEAEIKSEPMIKEEPESVGDIHMLPMSELDNNRPHNAIVGDQIDEINDFDGVCNLVEVKEEVKTENIEKKSEDISGGGHQSDVSMQSPDRGEQKATTSHGKATKGNGDSVCKSNRYNGKEGQAAAKPIGKQHKCTKCEYSTLKKSNFKTHILTHTGEKPFPCTLCSKRLTTKENLKRHMKTHVKEFLFSCSNCLHGFSQRNEQLEHEVACKVKRYECFLCKKYSTLYKRCLKEHMRLHSDERPFQCNDCTKKFTWETNMKRHMKTHINPRPLKFKCSICYRNFNQQAEKDDHEGHCKRRGFQCHVCQQFKSNGLYNLMKHMRTHTGFKPFQCGFCSKCFSQQAHYNRHIKIHK